MPYLLRPDRHKRGTLVLRETDPAASPNGRLEVFEIVDWTEGGRSVFLGRPGARDFPFKGGFWTADRYYFDILALPNHDAHVWTRFKHLRSQEARARYRRPQIIYTFPDPPPTIWQRLVKLFQPKKG